MQKFESPAILAMDEAGPDTLPSEGGKTENLEDIVELTPFC